MAETIEQQRLIDKTPGPERTNVSRFPGINYFVPFLFLCTILVPFMIIMGSSGPTDEHDRSEESPSYLKYTTVTGFFQQSEPATIADGFDYAETNFGLITRSYETDSQFDPDGKKTQWERFTNYLSHLNEHSAKNEQYKLLFMGRHGEGFHNVAESFYGTAAWDCYWSLLDGNTTSTWSDAHLTPTGIAQARRASQFWHSQLVTQKTPAPQTYYSSPLTRCLQTAQHTFLDLQPLLQTPSSAPFKPIVKELLRESIGAHTCDRRSTKSELQKMFPWAVFEEGFEEEDPWWVADLRETDSAEDERSRKVLDEIFGADGNQVLSISSHSGQISSALRVLNHRKFPLGTGQIITVLVKAERIEGVEPPRTVEPWVPVQRCEKPPEKLA